MAEEWGPWITHNGMPHPLPGGTLVIVQHLDGLVTEAVTKGRPPLPDEVDCWDWSDCEAKRCREAKIIRYRIRRPRGLTILQDLIEQLPETVEA